MYIYDTFIAEIDTYPQTQLTHIHKRVNILKNHLLKRKLNKTNKNRFFGRPTPMNGMRVLQFIDSLILICSMNMEQTPELI